MKILVTGGTGALGVPTVARLLLDGHQVRVLTRRARESGQEELEYVQGDLSTSAGLRQAVAGVSAVVHAGSSTRDPRQYQRADVEGTQALLREAREAGVGHFLFISIVGMEGIPYPYYRYKLRAETLVRQSDLPWSILRATQFHDLIDIFLRLMARPPLMLVPRGWKFQPVDTTDVAARIVEVITSSPAGMLPDFGGPEVLTLSEIAPGWLKARGLRKRVVKVPVPGRTSAAFRSGRLLTPDHRDGTRTWEQWLGGRYAALP